MSTRVRVLIVVLVIVVIGVGGFVIITNNNRAAKIKDIRIVLSNGALQVIDVEIENNVITVFAFVKIENGIPNGLSTATTFLNNICIFANNYPDSTWKLNAFVNNPTMPTLLAEYYPPTISQLPCQNPNLIDPEGIADVWLLDPDPLSRFP